MKRRQFLKSVSSVAAGVVVAPSVVKVKENKLRPPTQKDFQEALTEVVKYKLEAAQKAANPPYIIDSNGDVWTANQQYPLGTRRGGKIYVKYVKAAKAIKI